MFNENRFIQRTTGITQVNSVSGWISAGLRQWAQHKGGIEILSAVLMYSLSFLFSTHYISMLLQNVQICISPGLPGVTFGKAPRGKASERAAEKKVRRHEGGGHQQGYRAHVHLQRLMNDEDND